MINGDNDQQEDILNCLIKAAPIIHKAIPCKMAVNSATSVSDIKEIINSIKTEAVRMINRVVEASQLGERQAAASEEVSASMNELATSAENINQLSKIL